MAVGPTLMARPRKDIEADVKRVQAELAEAKELVRVSEVRVEVAEKHLRSLGRELDRAFPKL
jgi:hypothetical protein